ncbi:MAG: hypothetical protein M3305_10300 [Actinomycetota bacterium]|nr:hypothetical protein [Actinomycetota bacterium]
MGEQDERLIMSYALRQQDRPYTRTIEETPERRTYVTYQIGRAGPHFVAVWEYVVQREGQNNLLGDRFERRREKAFLGQLEAIQYLEEHYDDPLTTTDV